MKRIPSAGYAVESEKAEFFFLLTGSALVGLLTAALFPQRTLWAAAGIAFSFFALGYMCLRASRTVIFTELISFVACIQWILAPWLAYSYPPSYFLFVMAVPMETYLSFMVPATIALWLGLHLPTRWNPPARAPFNDEPRPLSRDERMLMDGTILFGLLVVSVQGALPAKLAFFWYILASLRFIGVFYFIFTNTPGWRIRAAVVFFLLLLDTAAGGVFYELILWSGYLFISLAFVRKWRWKLPAYLLLAMFLVFLLNGVKTHYRFELWMGNLSRWQKVRLLGSLMVGAAVKESPVFSLREKDVVGDTLVRYNQGWIASRVMTTVPRLEPYARGQTIWNAAAASIVPRAFLPTKINIASKEFFRRYTNMELSRTVSMGIGVAAEMYANFGRWGGIIGTFLYGLAIGSLFWLFARRARMNVLWWAWLPFVLLPAVEAEWNLVDILNHVTKSLAVMLFLIYAVPLFRARLFSRRSDAEIGS